MAGFWNLVSRAADVAQLWSAIQAAPVMALIGLIILALAVIGAVGLVRWISGEPWAPRIQFLGGHDQVNQIRGGLRGELVTVTQSWLATNTGIHPADRELFAMGRIKRLVLLDPDGKYLERFAAAFHRTAADLVGHIRTATARAQAAGVEVRWFDGPILGMHLGDPETEKAWIRAEVYVPWSTLRPGFLVRRQGNPQLFAELKTAFGELWDHSRRAN